MSERFELRDATTADMAVLRKIFREASLSNEGDREVLLANPEVLEFSPACVREGRTRVATASGGMVVGFATVFVEGDMFEIEDLFVQPAWMGRGAGRALVLDLVTRAADRGARRVEVTANDHALGFYSGLGFVVERHVSTVFGKARRLFLDVARS
jgi:GNAT superfamily N-acetyltransferase